MVSCPKGTSNQLCRQPIWCNSQRLPGRISSREIDRPSNVSLKDRLWPERPRDADAHVDDAIGRAGPDPRSRSGGLHVSAKGAAAKHMPAAIAAHPGRSIGRRAIVVVVPAILDPVIDVAVNLIEAPGIGSK